MKMKGLRYKLGLGYLVVVLIGLATSVFAVYNFSQLNDSVGLILRDNVRSVLAAQNMVKALERQENAQLSMLLDDIDISYVNFNANRVGFLGWHEQAKLGQKKFAELSLLDTIEATYRVYNQLTDSLYRLLQVRGKSTAATQFKFTILRPIAERLKEQCFQLLEINQDAMAQTEQRIRETTKGATLTVILASLASIVLSVSASIRFTRTILLPAEKLTRSVRNISQGHLNQKIDVITDDEIGELSREFNKMTERLRIYEEMNIQQLIAEKKKSETIVESIADPIIVTDRENRILLMNQAAAAVLSLRGKEWQGKSLRAVMRDERWAEMLKADSHKKKEMEQRDLLLTFERNGTKLYFRPRQASITDERGRVQGVVTLLQDVTRFKILDRMKSEFIATVSHELRTPLTSLSMSIDILSKEVLAPVNERQRELLAAAKDDCERLRKLLKELLDLSRLESGKYEMKKEPFTFQYLIDDALKPLRLPFREKQIELGIIIHPDVPQVVGDPQQLSWVVTNLVSNALRFTDSGGKVTIRADRESSAVRVSVTDTGRGIPQEAHETIFEKFVQVKEASETTPGSVGLGLAIAREVVEAHGGKIWVDSKPGKGSTFFFTIPLIQQPQES
ncbi:MAG: ATP-binding protein [Bacteroidota bacterium]